MDADEVHKIRYEKPTGVSLGMVAPVVGTSCAPGDSPTFCCKDVGNNSDGCCDNGYNAGGSCYYGNTAGSPGCSTGDTAQGTCDVGNGVT